MNDINTIFNDAWQNVNYQKIMNYAVAPYAKQIPYEDLNQCKCIALWECIRHYKPNYNNKFTSFLFMKTKWQCLKFFSYNKVKHKTKAIHDYAYTPKEIQTVDFVDFLDQLPPTESKVLYQKYVEGKTLHEIGRENGYCYETARKKLLEATENIELCLESC